MQERKMRPKRSKQGEIVEVEGGRIIRALTRKDRHSKVCTAKGPKDRRVRLSADTAIRFYDVQDRLGYDRPSLAIDWLMNEAKPAIEKLNCDHSALPAMNSSPPTIAVSHSQYFHQASRELDGYYNLNHNYETTENGIQNQQQNVSEFQNSIFSSFFNNHPDSSSSRNTSFFSANSTHLDFEGTGEVVQFQRMVTWNSNPSSSNGRESAQGFNVDSSLPWRLGHFSDQNHALFTQREPLQSSNLPSFQASVPFPAPNTSLGIGFADDGFMGFSFPAFIQDQEEEQENLISKQL